MILSALVLAAASSTTVAVTARFVPARRPGAPAAVEVRFAPADPEVHVNRFPPPRLDLEPMQEILKAAPAPAARPTGATYLGSAEPYRFPVVAKAPSPGAETVKGTVTYFYCSQREGWCRKGSADVQLAVKLH
ncbi:MAG TPA: hypothetical protein VGQ78_10465 [Vicinamibacteria bacterium]|nr:hypothetical protein [Vicinamibacteria bacterium]